MEEVAQRSRMSEESPPMQPPLIEFLEYNGITDYADQILTGTAPPVHGIDEYTQAYMNQLVSVKGVLPKQTE
eukprot:15326568-Ditylum_brightwellii.AAC.1